MTTIRTEFPKLAMPGAIFFLCWLAGFGVSLALIYSRFHWPDSHLIVFFLNQIFFYIQTALPNNFTTVGDNGCVLLSGPLAIVSGILFWLVVGFAFAWLTRRLRFYFVIPLAVVAIFVALVVAQASLYSFGIEVDVIAP